MSRREFVAVTGTASAALAASGREPVVKPAPVRIAKPEMVEQPIRIVTTYQFEGDEIRQIERAAAPVRVDIVICGTRREFLSRMSEAEVVYGALSAGEIENAPKLKWLQWGGAGVEKMPEDLRKSSIVVTNYARTFAPAIAETAMGLLLCLTRGIRKYYVPQFLRRSMKIIGTLKSDHHVELGGRTMGVVGMGGIGSAIARAGHYGFGMRVVGTDAKPLPKPEYVDALHDPGWFDEMVPQVDVLVAAAPHTPLTERMFNEEVFRRMKSTSYFIAMSRGMLFDDTALAKACREYWIAGAGLDVFPEEPPPPEHPIFECDNVVMTPHTSGWSPDRQLRLIALFADNVRRYSKGLPLYNVVDKEAGY